MESRYITPRRKLRDLLDKVTDAGRRDVYDFSRGHLNEANLYKPPDYTAVSRWKTTESLKWKPGQSVTPKSGSRTEKSPRREKMKDTLVNFSLGTTGSFQPQPPKSVNIPLEKPIIAPVIKRTISFEDAQGIRSTETYVDNGPVEKKATQTMLVEGAESDKEQDLFFGYKAAVTKKDQFICLKKIESDVIGKREAFEPNKTMHCLNSVEALENKLWAAVKDLEPDDQGPDFHSLQAYSNIFEDIVEVSNSLGFMLRSIKREYDAYIASLLDEPTGEYRVLCDQIKQLTEIPYNNATLLESERKRVEELEHQAEIKLAENERLRQAIREEMDTPLEPDRTPSESAIISYKMEGAPDIATLVEQQRIKILERLDDIKQKRAMLRKDYVPSTVCSHLQQCIKETEADIQRLSSNKEYFESSIKEMETELQEAITIADTTERDQRRVWKRISAGGLSPGSDDEQDDASKWNWYIS